MRLSECVCVCGRGTDGWMDGSFDFILSMFVFLIVIEENNTIPFHNYGIIQRQQSLQQTHTRNVKKRFHCFSNEQGLLYEAVIDVPACHCCFCSLAVGKKRNPARAGQTHSYGNTEGSWTTPVGCL